MVITNIFISQQSRFLALVSNYSRLAELTEEAANSQDAGTLQYLKTLDSIESKLNQLQVAFQEFYTSMGLEEVFKGAIDFATNLVNQLNDLPKAFDKIPVAAIAMIGNLVNALKGVAQLVFLPFYSSLRSFIRELETSVKIPPLKIEFDQQQNQRAAEEAGNKIHNALEQKTKLIITPNIDDKSTGSVAGWFKNNKKSLLTGIGSIASAALSTVALTSLTGKVTPNASNESNKLVFGHRRN